MSPTFVRPEDRQRSGRGQRADGGSADGPPQWRRSEAFAEDLVPAAALAAPPRAAVARLAPPSRRSPGWRGWRASLGPFFASWGLRRAGAFD